MKSNKASKARSHNSKIPARGEQGVRAEQPVDPFSNPALAPTDAAGTQKNGARFGCSRDGNTSMHYGTDLKAAVGTDFVSIYSGKVQNIRTDVSNEQNTAGSLGNYVIVRHKELGVAIKYCHLSEVTVEDGDAVAQGEQLGKSGRSGNAFNAPHPHIHIEVSTDYFMTAQKRVDPEPYLKTQYGANPNPIACQKIRPRRETVKEEEARKWLELEPIALAAFNLWNKFLDLRWGGANDKPLSQGAEKMFQTLIRCVSWVESRHGTGSGVQPTRDPMQCGHPSDAWWKELIAPEDADVDRFIRGPAETPNYDANELPGVMEKRPGFPWEAKLSYLDNKAEGHGDAEFNSKTSFFWAIPILIHKTNTNETIPADPDGNKRTYKCGDCSKARLVNGAYYYNGKTVAGYKANIERAWALVGGPDAARRKSARKR